MRTSVGTCSQVATHISAYYLKSKGKVYQLHNDQYIMSSEPNDCATKCNDGAASCDGFIYCPGEQLCRLAGSQTLDQTPVNAQGQCELYKSKSWKYCHGSRSDSFLNRKMIFLSYFSMKTYIEDSLEASRRDASNEYPQYLFLFFLFLFFLCFFFFFFLIDKKYNMWISSLF